MAVTVVPIQIRRGNEADFNASKMLPGEFAVSLDQKITRIAFAPGDVAILAKQADLDSLEARIEDVERDASSASDATTTLGNTVSTLSTRVSQAENDIDVLESDVDALETASTKTVKVNASQSFTIAEKTQARTNIGAASTEDVAGVVKYTAQTLTDAQKTQARSNIGAVSSAEVTGVVKYGEAQTLTDAQKTQVRVNTGTAAASAVAPEFATNKAYSVGDMVTYQGKMYTFKAAHSAGAWNAAHVNETNAGAEISNIKGDLNSFSDNAKIALLSCLRYVAWINNTGQTYCDVLEAALFDKYPKLDIKFTPGTHVVFTDDDLSSLSPYLTVTLYNDLSDSGTILSSSEYTLSGILEEGDNIVLVKYNNIQGTFRVNAVDYYNRHLISFPSDGTLSILQSLQGDFTTLSSGYPEIQFVIKSQNNRACIISSHGRAETKIVNENGAFMNSYFIPIPNDATKVKINLNPTSLYAYISYVVCWDDEYTGHHFYRHEDGGWVQNNAEDTFTKRDNQFLCLNFKANESGNTPVSVTGVTIQFS